MTLEGHKDPAARSAQSQGQGAVSPSLLSLFLIKPQRRPLFAAPPPVTPLGHSQPPLLTAASYDSHLAGPSPSSQKTTPASRPLHLLSSLTGMLLSLKKKKKDPRGSVLIPFKALLQFTLRPSPHHSQYSLHLQLGFPFLHRLFLSNCFILAPEQWLAHGRNSQNSCQLNGQKREVGNGTAALGRRVSSETNNTMLSSWYLFFWLPFISSGKRYCNFQFVEVIQNSLLK